MKDKIIIGLLIITAGMLLMVGQRLVAWVVPAPPISVYACVQNVDTDVGKCVEYMQTINGLLPKSGEGL